MSVSFNGDNLRGMRYFIEYARHLGVLAPQKTVARDVTGILRRVPYAVLNQITSHLAAADTSTLVRSAGGFKDRAIQLYKGDADAAQKLLAHCKYDVSQLSQNEKDQLTQLGRSAKTLDMARYYMLLQSDGEPNYGNALVDRMRAVFNYTPRVEHFTGLLCNETTMRDVQVLGTQLRSATLFGYMKGTPNTVTASQLIQLLESYTGLEKLHLVGYNVSGGVLSSLQKLPRITDLGLHNCTGVPLDAIDRIAKHLPKLKKLCLDYTGNDGEAAAEALSSVSKLTCLQSLELNDFLITDALMQCFGTLSKLEELALDEFLGVTDAGIRALLGLNLQTLSLQNLTRGISAEAFDALFQSQKNLKNLLLNDLEASKLRGIVHCQQLSTLELQDIEHFDRDAAPWMKELRALTKVTLEDCSGIGNATLEAFSQMPLLRSLDLSTDSSHSYIDMQNVSADWALPQLKTLYIGNTAQNTDAACRLLQGCQGVEALTVADYAGKTPVINEQLLQYIGTLSKLRELKLDTQTMPTKEMLELLSQLKGLRKLDIKCKAGATLDISELQKQLPHTKITTQNQNWNLDSDTEGSDGSDSDVSDTDSSSSDSDSDISSTDSSSDSDVSSTSSSDSDSDTDSSSSDSDSDISWANISDTDSSSSDSDTDSSSSSSDSDRE